MISHKDLAQRFELMGEREGSRASLVLFFISLGLWLIVTIVSENAAPGGFIREQLVQSGLADTLRCISLLMLLVREIAFGVWDRITFLEFCVAAFLGWSALSANYFSFFDMVCFVFAARNLSFEQIARFSFIGLVTIILLIMMAIVVGLNTDIILNNGRYRHSMGFFHPNTFSMFVFFILCLWVYLRGSRFSLVDALATAFISALVFYFTNSRTSFILSLVLIGMSITVRFVPKRVVCSRGMQVGVAVLVPAIAISNIVITIAYDPAVPLMSDANTLLSNRLALGHKALLDAGITVMGTPFNFTYPVDSAYVTVLIKCGIVSLGVAIALYTMACVRASRKGHAHLIVILILIVFIGWSENCNLFLQFNQFLLILGCWKTLSHGENEVPIGKHCRS